MADPDVVLVSGATGNTGSGVAAALLADERPVRAIVRDEEKADWLREAGAELAVCNLERPETIPDDLLDSVLCVYFVTWNGPTALQQTRNLLDAITRSGVSPHVVRLSGFGTPESRIISELEKCEEDLKASGLPWTIVKPTFFMQNLLTSAQSIQEQSAIYWDWGSGKVGMVDVRDVVDSVLGALTSERQDVLGETYVLTGPESIGLADAAETLSEVLGKDVEYVPVSHEAATDAMVAMGAPRWIAEGYAELSAGFADGYADLTTNGVLELGGHDPRSFGEFVLDHAVMFTGAASARSSAK